MLTPSLYPGNGSVGHVVTFFQLVKVLLAAFLVGLEAQLKPATDFARSPRLSIRLSTHFDQLLFGYQELVNGQLHLIFLYQHHLENSR